MLSRAFRIGVLLFTLIQIISTSAFSSPDPNRFEPLLKTNWYGLYMQGAKIGYAEMTLEKIEAPVPGWNWRQTLTIIMKVGDQQMSMVTDDVKFYRAPDGELYSNTLTISSPTGNITVEGKNDGNKYTVVSNIGGQQTETILNYPLDYLDSALYIESKILSGGIAVGDSFAIATFEATPPLTGLVHVTGKITSQEKYIFNGLPTDVFAVEVVIKEMNVASVNKIDSYGNTLLGTIGGVMTLKLEDREIAQNLDVTFDMLLDNLVIPLGKIENPDSLISLKLLITGIDTSGILKTPMQQLRPTSDGIEVLITSQNNPENSLQRPITDANFEPYLLNEPYIQSADPGIKKLAGEIIGNENNSWDAARKINEWVYKNIEKKFTASFSNALETLNSKQGDCGEHTALAVALLRASGIPARPIAGLLFVPRLGGFGYHAWVEAYVGNWIQMDPTWNEELANPAHIALARGDIISQATTLSNVMGKIKIEVLEVK